MFFDIFTLFFFDEAELEKFLSQLLKPSICSNNSGFIVAPSGSKIKSIPSRLASFEAETKSLSPEINII